MSTCAKCTNMHKCYNTIWLKWGINQRQGWGLVFGTQNIPKCSKYLTKYVLLFSGGSKSDHCRLFFMTIPYFCKINVKIWPIGTVKKWIGTVKNTPGTVKKGPGTVKTHSEPLCTLFHIFNNLSAGLRHGPDQEGSGGTGAQHGCCEQHPC